MTITLNSLNDNFISCISVLEDRIKRFLDNNKNIEIIKQDIYSSDYITTVKIVYKRGGSDEKNSHLYNII